MWRPDRDDLAIDIRPIYRVDQVGPRAIRRRYTGAVSVDIALVGGHIERGIIGELSGGLARTATLTQGWLDKIACSVAARA